ncbi:hypothetical protein H5P28_13370 [Ruficoccus amylovorans]|uniref:Uncharacterized protein n=1 Tax=Ruficoccus amylovorans TaxID=1804625 RepID=A0A842HFR9_9BACT|nr:hypothetical protein [Ruficoccus amylovorans]MBC2595252.1 hypothetical protein [Ruficoccus amylovorans]
MLAAGVLLPSVRAQVEEQPKNTFRLTALSGSFDGWKCSGYSSSDSFQPIIAQRYISGPYPLEDRRMVFFKQDEATGEKATQTIATVPAGIRQPLIVLCQLPQRLEDGTVLPYTALVLDDSLKSTPLNSIRIVNMSRYPTMMAFGGQTPAELAPGQSTLVSHPPLEKDMSAVMQLAVSAPGGEWKKKKGELFLRKNGRHYVLLNLDPFSDDTIPSSNQLITISDLRRLPPVLIEQP